MSLSIGIDIGATNVKLISLKKESGRTTLMAHGFYKRKNITAIQEAFQSGIIQKGNVRVNIEDPSMKIRKVDLPLVPEEELPEIIKWSLKDVLADQVDHYFFRHQRLPQSSAGNGSPEKQSFLVFAVKKSSLEEYQVFLKKLGIGSPSVIEPNVSALSLGFRTCYSLPPEDRVVLIDMGSTFTHFMVFFHGGVLFSRPLGGMAGESLTKQISRNLGVEEEKAEEMKVAFQGEGKIAATIAHFFSRGAIEIQRSIDAYLTQFPGQAVTKIYFTGGGSKLHGLLKNVEETLQIPTALYQPLQKVDCSQFDAKGLEEKFCFYGLAFGLALDS